MLLLHIHIIRLLLSHVGLKHLNPADSGGYMSYFCSD